MSEPVVGGGNGAGELLQLDDIERVYEVGGTEVRALDGVDLDVRSGEYMAIMGASGSGKSTLMNIIGCLDRPTAGQYRLDGQRVDELDDDALADVRNRRIGFVFQSFNLLPRQTAWENAALPLIYAGVSVGERRRRAEAALERVGLGDRIEHRPNELSGGQRQRVAIARALINHPNLVLADEPTGNLDSKTSEEVMDLLDDLHQGGTTLVLVTHEQEIATRCSRRVVMLDGRIIEDDGQSA